MDSIYLSSLNKTYDLELLNQQWQFIISTLYIATAIFSLTANLLAIFVLLTCDRFTSEIWKYLINLSISDILMAIFCIPFTYTSFMLGQWIFPTWLCPIVQSAQLCSVFVSVYTLTIIGFDRYFAIIYPFHRLIFTKTHRIQVLSFIWLIGIIFSSIQLIQSKAVPFLYGNETLYDCKELWNEEEGKYFTIIIFIITFGLPIFALIFVYVSIGIHLMRNKAPGNPNMARDIVQLNIKIKVIKMLVTIVILFVLCWLPIHIHTFIVWFYPIEFHEFQHYILFVLSFFICHWLAMAHSFLNPIIYGFMSENFKKNARKLFLQRRQTNRSEAEMEKLSNVTNFISKTDTINETMSRNTRNNHSLDQNL